MAAIAADSMELSAKEAEIYDRQIRLWGVDAQRRMRGSRVLLAGFRSLNAELCKNLVLAGIGVTIQDDGVVSQPDLASVTGEQGRQRDRDGDREINEWKHGTS